MNLPLPPNHHHETLAPSSPAVVLGRTCPITGQELRAGDAVVICDLTPSRDPITTEGWSSADACPHCGTSTGVGAPFIPSTWTGIPTNAPPPPPARPFSGVTKLPPWLLGGLAAVALVALCAVFFAALTYGRRTAAPTAVVQVTATAGATVPGVGPTTALASATPDGPAPTATAAVPTVTLAPTLTPAPSATATPSTTPTALPTPNPWPLTPLLLADAETDEVIRPLHTIDIVTLEALESTRLVIVADFGQSNIGSVRFLLNGEPFCPRDACVENAAPFVMGGDQGGNYYDDWDWSGMVGEQLITAVACTGRNGNGNCTDPVEVRLSVRR